MGPNLWSYSGELEIRERIALDEGWGEFPEFILGQSIFDIAMNQKWPLNPWQLYIETFDETINEDWPKP